MKFKSIGIKAVVLATAVIGGAVITAAPSQAASITDGGTIEIIPTLKSNALVKFDQNKKITGLNFVGKNAGKIQVSDATGGFATYIGDTGFIKNLVFSNGVSGSKDNFLSIGADLFFDLSSAVASFSGTAADFDFLGTYNNSMGEILGSGTLTTQVKFVNGVDTPSSFSISGETAPVPTPALLPGLVGMGVAALRKRKSEEEAVEEAVEV